jgi:hypothetical protein
MSALALYSATSGDPVPKAPPQKFASKKPNSIKGVPVMQNSLETPNVGYLVRSRRSGFSSALAPKETFAVIS